MKCRLEDSQLEIYGMMQNTETGQYMMVYQYANRGNLFDFLSQYFKKLTWKICLEFMKLDLFTVTIIVIIFY